MASTSGGEKETVKSRSGFTSKKERAVCVRRTVGFMAKPSGGDVLNTFTIITTDPNALVRPIHNRMPVIYDKEMGKQWLEHSFGDWARTLAAVHPGYDLYEPKRRLASSILA